MSSRLFVTLVTVPFVIVACLAAGFGVGRASAPKTHPPIRPNVVPRTAIVYAAQLQTELALSEDGIELQRPVQVNTVARHGSYFLVNVTVVPSGTAGIQLDAKLNAKTLKITSLRAFNGDSA